MARRKGRRPGRRAKPKAKSTEQSARHRPGLPPPHVGRPVRGCTCLCCQMHRKLNRLAARDAALGQLYDYHGGKGSVQVGATATQALRDALGAT